MTARARRTALAWCDGDGGGDLGFEPLAERLRPDLVFVPAGRVAPPGALRLAKLAEAGGDLDLVLLAGPEAMSAAVLAEAALDRAGAEYAFLAAAGAEPDRPGALAAALRGARFATVRDHAALARLGELLPGVETWWLPDPVFLLARRRPPARDGAPNLLLIPGEASPGVLDAMARLAASADSPDGVVALESGQSAVLADLGFPSRSATPSETAALAAGASAVVTATAQGAALAAVAGAPFVLVEPGEEARAMAALLHCEHRCVAADDLGRIDLRLVDETGSADPDAPARAAAAFAELLDRLLGWLSR